MRLLKCPRSTHLSDEALACLSGLPNPGMVIEPEVSCELEVGHTDRHCCLGQVAASGDYFVYWDRTGHDIHRTCLCQRTAVIGEEELTCVLPADHWGAHSFELKPH